MKTANQHGVYEHDTREEVARHNRANAAISFCHCDNGLFRFALHMEYSYGGFGGPITREGTGYTSMARCRDEALAALLDQLPTAQPDSLHAHEPQSAQDEVAAMQMQIARRIVQPSLF